MGSSKQQKILVIGSINMDMLIHVVDIPKIGETILGEYGGNVPGGKGANQAYAAAKLGGSVRFLGKVGNDANAEALISNLASSGCIVDDIKKEKGAASGFAMIEITAAGNNSIIVVSGANSLCDAEYITENEALIASVDIVMLQLEIPIAAVYKAIELAKKHDKRIILNPAPAVAKIPSEILSKVDYLTPNESELEALTGIPVSDENSAKAACDVLHKAGVGVVLATLGSSGALYSAPGEKRLFEVRKVKVLDTTAAGDTFNGAFAVALAEGAGYEKAVKFANDAASISVTRNGAQSSIPSRAEVDNIMT